MKLVSTNPSENYQVLGEVETSTQADVSRAVENARKAQTDWATASLDDRVAAVRSFGAVSEKRYDDVATLIAIETGRPLSPLLAAKDYALDYIESDCRTAAKHLGPKETMRTASEVHTVYREPRGVVAAILPWNYPFLNITWQCIQALLAGNTMVYKNSEENPLFAELVTELFAASDVPDGVFNVVQGDGTVGNWLVESDVDMISFTGSSKTGKDIAQIAARRFVPFMAELGGSSPAVVFEDADIDDVVNTVFWNRFSHSGQFCDATKRVIVHETKFDELTSKLVAMAEVQKIGPAIDPDTTLGPLVAERQVVRIESQVDDSAAKGARILTGGKRPDNLKGAYYLPTIMTGITPDMRVWREETFGPALPIVSFRSEAEAIELANDTPYGLTASVMTNDSETFARVARQIRAGSVVQNACGDTSPTCPFGGYKDSGMGRVHGEFGFDEITQPKMVATQI